MCFAPQRRALSRHVNFQKWSDTEVLCTFWLGNLLRTTTAYTLSQLPKVLRDCVLCKFWLRHVLRATTACNFSSLIWPDGSAPAALASLLFDPLEQQIIGKTCDFSTCSFFWLFLVSDLLSSSLLFSSLLFSTLTLPSSAFSFVHIVGSLTSKLPSGNSTYFFLQWLQWPLIL